jgi:hypothetical protein
MTNDLGSTPSPAPYYGQELIYSSNVVSLSRQYSIWEINCALYTNPTNGISVQNFPITTNTIFGIRLTNALWFDPTDVTTTTLSCSVMSGEYCVQLLIFLAFDNLIIINNSILTTYYILKKIFIYN